MSDAAKRTARTVLQSAVGIAVVLPALVDASGLPETLPGSPGRWPSPHGLTRVMALDAVQHLLPSWLRNAPAPGGADDRA